MASAEGEKRRRHSTTERMDRGDRRRPGGAITPWSRAKLAKTEIKKEDKKSQ
jgi:hypothetical protein